MAERSLSTPDEALTQWTIDQNTSNFEDLLVEVLGKEGWGLLDGHLRDGTYYGVWMAQNPDQTTIPMILRADRIDGENLYVVPVDHPGEVLEILQHPSAYAARQGADTSLAS